MTIQLFANNAKTTLAAAITSSQTTIGLAPGTGALFPNPSAGQAFKLTLNSATSTSLYEICLCTARSGDTLTVVRGQEGTTATSFALGDFAGNFDTAGVMSDLVQTEQLQTNYYTYTDAGGTANALTASVTSNLTALSDGMMFIVNAAYANTGATTFNLTLGSTVTGAIPVVLSGNIALSAGQIPSAGTQLILIYSSAYSAWILANPSIILTSYAPLNSPAFTGTPTAPTPTTSDNSTKLATTAYVQNNLLNYAPIYSPTLTGIPAAPTATAGTNTTQLATTAFVTNAVVGLAPLASPALTGTPTAPTPSPGDSSFKIATTAFVTSAGLGNPSQTWKNVTSSRAFGTVYHNTTAAPIIVWVTGSNGGGFSYDAYVGTTSTSLFYVGTQGTYNGVGGMNVIVPAGNYYKVVAGGNTNILQWTEFS